MKIQTQTFLDRLNRLLQGRRITPIIGVFAALVVGLSAAAGPDPSPTIVHGEMGEQLDDLLTRSVPFGFSGSVVVAKGGTTLLQKGYGLANRELGILNTPDTLYDIASAAKQITAAAILKLEAQNKLSVRDSIADWLPEVPEAHHGVSIHHLLTHTSGFPRMGPTGGGGDAIPAAAGYLSGPRVAEPGERFEYWNGGYALLAMIIEKASGQSYEDYCREELFAPAHMTSTGFCRDDSLDGSQIAHGYEGGQDIGPASAHSFGWEYKGMGGVLASAADLYRWDRVLTVDTVLPPASRMKLVTPFLSEYAYGWYVSMTSRGTRRAWHGGAVRGFETQFWRLLDEDVTIIVLSNTPGSAYAVTFNLHGVLFGDGAVMGAPPKTISLDTESLLALEGNYEGPDGSRLELRMSGNGLSVGIIGQATIEAMLFDGQPSRPVLTNAVDEALRIVQGIVDGDVGPFREAMADRIPASWPDDVITIYWPQHLEKHGPVESLEVMGAVYAGPSAARVVVALGHERGESRVEIVIRNGRLQIFDLNGREFPLEMYYMPTAASTFATYDFTPFSPPSIEFRSGASELVVRSMFSREVVFTRAKP